MTPDPSDPPQSDPVLTSTELREHLAKLLKEMQRLREESERLRRESEESRRIVERPDNKRRK